MPNTNTLNSMLYLQVGHTSTARGYDWSILAIVETTLLRFVPGSTPDASLPATRRPPSRNSAATARPSLRSNTSITRCEYVSTCRAVAVGELSSPQNRTRVCFGIAGGSNGISSGIPVRYISFSVGHDFQRSRPGSEGYDDCRVFDTRQVSSIK